MPVFVSGFCFKRTQETRKKKYKMIKETVFAKIAFRGYDFMLRNITKGLIRKEFIKL